MALPPTGLSQTQLDSVLVWHPAVREGPAKSDHLPYNASNTCSHFVKDRVKTQPSLVAMKAILSDS